MPLRVRGQTPLPAGPRETPRPRSPPSPIVLPQAAPPPPLVFELPTVAPAPSTSPTIMRVVSPRVRETVVSRPRPPPAPTPAPQPPVVYTNSVVQVPTAPRTPNLMVRVRGTTPIPDHEPGPEPELVPKRPVSPVLVPPSHYSASDIGIDQPRPSTPAPERQSMSQQTPPAEQHEEQHERPVSAAAPIPPHPTVIQVPVPPPSRTAFIRMVTPVIPEPPEVTTVAQPLIPAPIEAAPIAPEPPAPLREPSLPPPTVVTVPAPFTAPTSQVRVKGWTQDRAPTQTLPTTATEPSIQPIVSAEPPPIAAVPESNTLPSSPHSPVVIELPGEIPPATTGIASGRTTPVIHVRRPIGYSPVVIGTPARPPTVTLRARSRSQVRGPPMVHEVPTSTPMAVQQVVYGRNDEPVTPSTRAQAAIPRPRAPEAGSFSIHSPRPISIATVPVARHLEENLANQEAQRVRDAVIHQLMEEQRAFMEEHRAFMTRAAGTTAAAQDNANDTAARTASLRVSVHEVAEESKRRSFATASIHSIVLDEHATALTTERQRAQELEEKLAVLRTRRAEQRAKRENDVQEKCEEGRIAATERHQNMRNQLGDITNSMQNAADEKANWQALQDQRWAEKQERQDRKKTQIQRLEEMMARTMGEQENARRMAEEDAVASALRPGYAEVIAQLEWQNEEQLALLQTLLACEFLDALIPTHSNLFFPQPIRRTSSIAIAKQSRPCGKLPKNMFHSIFPII
jgi:hypothetical protein